MNTTSNTAPNKGKSFTLDTLAKIQMGLAQIPPAPVFASWEHFPKDHALKFTHDAREYVCAHPDFWKQLPAADRGQVQQFGSIKIIDLALPFYAKEKQLILAVMRERALAMLDDLARESAT